jgi:hypothetical protein
LWAIWSTNEAFHEGWWKPTLVGRLQQTAMYHAPLAIMLLLNAVSLRSPRLGGIAYLLFGAWFSWFIFSQRWGHITWEIVLSWLPLTLMLLGVGLLWWYGRPRPLKLAAALALGLPLLVSLACAVEPVWRISQRDFAAQLQMQTVAGNGIALTWAPAGPGWVRDVKQACDWLTAQDICARLSADGSSLLDTPQNIWRLPTVPEAVASLTRHGRNAGGSWDAARGIPSYKVRPDKEPPLWDPLSETIYWWTATPAHPDTAYIVVYNGGVYERTRVSRYGSLGFRAVKAEP